MMRSGTFPARFHYVLLASLIGGVAAGCAGPGPQAGGTPPSTATSQPSATPTRAPSQAPTQGNRYTNDVVGFSMILPEGWTVAEPVDVEADSVAYQSYALGLDPAAEGGPGMSRIVIGDAASLTVAAFVLQQCQTCPDHPVEDVTLDGQPAQQVLIGGGGVPFMVQWTFVRIGESMVGFSIHDPETLAPLPDVLASVELP